MSWDVASFKKVILKEEGLREGFLGCVPEDVDLQFKRLIRITFHYEAGPEEKFTGCGR